jgi:kynurenine 3-monooxygenase
MRDLVGDAEFLHFKHVEHELTELYPGTFRSQYELVTFSNEPYQYALEQGARNSEMVKEIINRKMEASITDKAAMQPLFDKYLK